MGKHKILIFTFLLLIGSAYCSARQLSFQIVQRDGTADVSEQSLTIEDEVLTNFFDYGYIVTNSEAAVSSSLSQDEKLYNIGIGEAIEGFSDFFVQIKLYYDAANQTGDVPELKKIDWVLASTKSGEKLKNHTITDIKLQHKEDDMKKISSVLAAEINSALKAK
ncbi:MAG: hypothetical protein K5786_03620 [Treponema sp.]|nr:hypothetical protein [Treponema sp.]MCR4630696.1 hypothetical protein [Treponema sp.]